MIRPRIKIDYPKSGPLLVATRAVAKQYGIRLSVAWGLITTLKHAREYKSRVRWRTNKKTGEVTIVLNASADKPQ